MTSEAKTVSEYLSSLPEDRRRDLSSVYGDRKAEAALRSGIEKAGKKLDMGKSCVRFRKPEDLDLKSIARAVSHLSVEQFISLYERSRRRDLAWMSHNQPALLP